MERRTLNGYRVSHIPILDASKCFGGTRLFRADVAVEYRGERFRGLPASRTDKEENNARSRGVRI